MISVLVDIPTLVSYKPKFPKATDKAQQSQFTLQRVLAPTAPRTWYQQPRKVVILTAVITGLMLFSVSAGYDFPVVLIPVSWIVPVVSSFHGHQLSMRRVTQVLWGYIVSPALCHDRCLCVQALLVTVAAIMVPIAMHYSAKDDAKSPEEHAKEAQDAVEEAAKWSQPSAWIGHLLEMFQYLYIVGGPGVFVSGISRETVPMLEFIANYTGRIDLAI